MLLYSLQKGKGTLRIIEIENPNLVKPKTVKAKEADVSWTVYFLVLVL